MKNNSKHLLLAFILTVGIINTGFTQELEVGDRLPDKYYPVANAAIKQISLAKTGKKLVILDFWSHNCISCLKAFPDLNALQSQFSQDIQIILVNRETYDSTLAFFKKKPKVTKPELPMISGIKELLTFFPNRTFPYQIWIDSSGKVCYKAKSVMANPENITAFLNGEKIPDLYSYKKERVNSLFDPDISASVEQYSYLAKCLNNTILQGTTIPGYVIRTYNCTSATELYKYAFSRETNNTYSDLFRPGRLILECRDSIKYLRPKEGDKLNIWLENYSYNYQVKVQESKKEEIQKIMKEDLKRYFGLNSRLENRKVKTMVLVQIGSLKKLKTKGAIPSNTFHWSDERTPFFDSLRTIINQDFSVFVIDLKNYIELKFDRPFANSIAYNGNIDISLTGKTIESYDLKALNRELKQYNLALIDKEWPLEVLVISDRFE